MSFFVADIENSSLYDRSVKVNCLFKQCLEKENSSEKYNPSYCSTSFAHASCVDSEQELRLFRSQDNVCAVKPDSYDNTVYPDIIGFDANVGMMYPLDEFNTYRNYPVCTYETEDRKNCDRVCAPKNNQIFDNHTRKNHEIPRATPTIVNRLIMEKQDRPSQKDDHKCLSTCYTSKQK